MTAYCNLAETTKQYATFPPVDTLTSQMDKIVISPAEVAVTKALAEQPAQLEPKLAAVVPWWAKASLAPLVLVLPVLCVVVAVLRAAMRNLPPRTRHGWTAFLNTLLIISGLLTSLGAVIVLSFVPLPSVASTGLSELDERVDFPHLPATLGPWRLPAGRESNGNRY